MTPEKRDGVAFIRSAVASPAACDVILEECRCLVPMKNSKKIVTDNLELTCSP